MNTQTRTADQTTRPAAASTAVAGSSRRTYRSREVGIGYGRSSGYGLLCLQGFRLEVPLPGERIQSDGRVLGQRVPQQGEV